jgi:hypothetical protein
MTLPYTNYTDCTASSTSWINSGYTNTTSTGGFDYYYQGTTTAGDYTFIRPIASYYREYESVPAYKPPTPEEMQRAIDLDHMLAEKRRLDHQEREEASRKARILLIDYADDENKERLQLGQPFIEVRSTKFKGVKYKIPVESNERIKACRGNNVITELCLTVADHGMPTDDAVLTKMLHAMHDEENMLAVSNHFNQKENLKPRLILT